MTKKKQKKPTDKQMLDFVAMRVTEIDMGDNILGPKSCWIEYANECGTELREVGTADTGPKALRAAIREAMRTIEDNY
jgi:hypothetical protein